MIWIAIALYATIGFSASLWFAANLGYKGRQQALLKDYFEREVLVIAIWGIFIGVPVFIGIWIIGTYDDWRHKHDR